MEHGVNSIVVVVLNPANRQDPLDAGRLNTPSAPMRCGHMREPELFFAAYRGHEAPRTAVHTALATHLATSCPVGKSVGVLAWPPTSPSQLRSPDVPIAFPSPCCTASGAPVAAMLSAFTARPIIELKQRDKSKIETILAYGICAPLI